MRPSILKTGQCTRYRLSIVWGKLWRLNPGAASYRASDLVPWHYPDGPAGTNNGDPYDTNLDRNALPAADAIVVSCALGAGPS